jgi:hypothetical protein
MDARRFDALAHFRAIQPLGLGLAGHTRCIDS